MLMTSEAPAEINAASNSGSGPIKVYYPQADSVNFSTGDINALRRLEPVIVSIARAFFLSDSHYHWVTDEEAGCPTQVQLIQTSTNLTITSQPLEFLRCCTPDEFHEILREA